MFLIFHSVELLQQTFLKPDTSEKRKNHLQNSSHFEKWFTNKIMKYSKQHINDIFNIYRLIRARVDTREFCN